MSTATRSWPLPGRRPLSRGVVVVVLAMALLSCGGGGGPATETAPEPAAPPSRIPSAQAILEAARKQSWGKDIAEIPAVPIDTGVFRNVPYRSYRQGDYEINVYGDPAAPAGFEIGVYGSALADIAAKDDCKYFVLGVLPDPADQEIVRGLNMSVDKKYREGLAFEVTPPNAGDAFAGFWISVFDGTKLADVRK